MRAANFPVLLLCALLGAAAASSPAAHADPIPGLSGPVNQAALQPSRLEGLTYDVPFFVDADGKPPAYADNVPTGEKVLGYPIGQRAATHAEIERSFKAWDGMGPAGADANAAPQVRARLFEHGQTWEGRTLYHMAISSPANIARLEEIRKDMVRLSDQREVSQADADKLAETLPAVAWMAYSIHGDETSGSDAALALAYHLIAATDAETQSLLDNLIIIIDPLMNPDGRDRFLKMIAEHRAANPNVDDRSLLHSGYWPYGRTNHYYFDLNRDWIFATQPETRGRIAALRQWNPQLFIDAHEMYSQDTFLMSPSREPYNIHHPVNRKGWMEKFAAAQAQAFDHYGWRYYTGEWNEGWYPGYSDSWAAFRGAIGMLFEQARIAEDGVRRPEGTILTYRQSVHHQAVGSLANLRALRDNKAQVMKDYAKERRQAIAGDGANANRVIVLTGLSSSDGSLLSAFQDIALSEALRAQGIEARLTKSQQTVRAARAIDPLGRTRANVELKGALVIVPLRQPDSGLASALLEFDPRMSDEFLRRERRELLRTGSSRLYDTTAWNLPMLFDAKVYALDGVDLTSVDMLPPEPPPGTFTADAERQTQAAAGEGAKAALRAAPDSAIGWRIYPRWLSQPASLAARLMERGIAARLCTKGSQQSAAKRGEILVLRADNVLQGDSLRDALMEFVSDGNAMAFPIDSGLGAGNENPDLGSEHFPLLTRPRIAILSRGALSDNNVGECWFTVDQRLGVRASLLDIDSVSSADLRRYNVLIAPDAWDTEALLKAKGAIATWVRQGGTLIAIGASAAALATGPEADKQPGADPKFGYVDPAGAPGGASGGAGPLTQVRQLHDVLDKLDEYELQILREWEARHTSVDPKPVWSNTVDPASIAYPWAPKKKDSKDADADTADPDKPAPKPERKWAAGDDAPRPAAPAAGDAKKEAKPDASDGESSGAEARLSMDELKRRDAWNRRFMPTGAVLATRLDDRHWLTIGCRMRPESLIDESDETPEQRAEREAKEAEELAARGGGDDYLPVLYTGGTILMAAEGVEAPIRFGYYTPAGENSEASASAGWARNPPGHNLTLRMSGLLWPEAAVRIANSAFVTREPLGSGQVILFACSPTFRGATLGTSRIFENAVVFGPGLGARAPIIP